MGEPDLVKLSGGESGVKDATHPPDGAHFLTEAAFLPHFQDGGRGKTSRSVRLPIDGGSRLRHYIVRRYIIARYTYATTAGSHDEGKAG